MRDPARPREPLLLVPEDDDIIEDFLRDRPEIDPLTDYGTGKATAGLPPPHGQSVCVLVIRGGVIPEDVLQRKLAQFAVELRALQPQADAWVRTWMVTKPGAARGKFKSNPEPWRMGLPDDPWLETFRVADTGDNEEAIYHLQADACILVGLPMPLAQRYVRRLHAEDYISEAVPHEKLTAFTAEANNA